MVMPIVVASIITGQLISRIGYYTPFIIIGVCLTAVGAALLTTLEIDTSEGKWIGFQVGLITACLPVLGALGMEWRSIKKNLLPKNPDGERAAEEGKNRDAAAAVWKVSTEATRTASQVEVEYTLTLNTVEKTEQKTKERTETEKADAKDIVA